MKAKPVRTKHVPQRTCVGCRTVLAKKGLIRVVRTVDGLRIDPTGKLAGRGAYVHKDPACWKLALKGSLAASLKTEMSTADRTMLEDYMQHLADGNQTNIEVTGLPS